MASFNGDAGTSEFSESVKLVTLDSLELGRCDFLKVDTEGYEYKALLGAVKTISKYKPYIFLESTHTAKVDGKYTNEVLLPLKTLSEMGYLLYLPAWKQSNGSYFIGIGPDFEMENFALLPFQPNDRFTFPGEAINIFAVHVDAVANLKN